MDRALERRLAEAADDARRTVVWREALLRELGYDAEQAALLAELRELDVHALAALIARGCPPATAARILAPL